MFINRWIDKEVICSSPHFQFFWVHMRNGAPGSFSTSFWFFEESPSCFLPWLPYLTFTIVMWKFSNFSASWTTLVSFCVFSFGVFAFLFFFLFSFSLSLSFFFFFCNIHLNGYKIVSHCGLKDWCWSWNFIFWLPDAKSWIIGKDSDDGKEWG